MESIRNSVLFAKRSCSHPQLEGWLEVFKNLPPIVFVLRTSTVAFINYNQVKKIWGILLEETRSAFVFCYRLICREIDIAALDCVPLNLPTSVTKRSEHLVLGIVYQYVSIC